MSLVLSGEAIYRTSAGISCQRIISSPTMQYLSPGMVSGSINVSTGTKVTIYLV